MLQESSAVVSVPIDESVAKSSDKATAITDGSISTTNVQPSHTSKLNDGDAEKYGPEKKMQQESSSAPSSPSRGDILFCASSSTEMIGDLKFIVPDEGTPAAAALAGNDVNMICIDTIKSN
jgi:hypothetical protein